jgi:hypothetical protein
LANGTTEPEREKSWRRNAPNELIVNSILTAVSTIVVQTMVSTERPRYGAVWLLVAVASLILFLVSTEQLGESMREEDIDRFIRSMVFYNLGVLLLMFSMWAIFFRDVANSLLSLAVELAFIPIWGWFWGFDTAFLVCRSEQYRRWKHKMNGEAIEDEILDYRDAFVAKLKSWTHRT